MKRKAENRDKWRNWMPWTCQYAERSERGGEERHLTVNASAFLYYSNCLSN